MAILIVKTGKVIITQSYIEIEGFEFDGEGKNLTMRDFAVAACEWAFSRAEFQLDNAKIITGVDTTVNGVPFEINKGFEFPN